MLKKKKENLLQRPNLRISNFYSKQPAISAALYSGMQCSSCGARFAPELATRYSHHLDWHFRQNRRERDSARKAHSRPWYYDVSDWIQFEEIEDLEDRAQSWFETEKQTAETEGVAADESPQETQQPSVPTGNDEDSRCQVCHDAFEQFYNEEKEEWHLRPAVLYEGKNYHPLCLEDYKVRDPSALIDNQCVFKSRQLIRRHLINETFVCSILTKIGKKFSGTFSLMHVHIILFYIKVL